MPELPEVETTLRGIKPHVLGQRINGVEVRERRLRWPIPKSVDGLVGSKIIALSRRGKYLLLEICSGTLILHLGMSGSLRIVGRLTDWRKHDHVEFCLSSGKVLRFHDPRRFGCVLFCKSDPMKHRLIRRLGPEPLSDQFTGAYLLGKARGKAVSIKQFIMSSHLVVGIGNIYACEVLHLAGIHPKRAAGRIAPERHDKLVAAIKNVLKKSIQMGGTTLRDFLHEDGQPGYFKQSLMVYGREGESCRSCGNDVRRIIQSGRSTFYCNHCQR